MSNRQRAFTLVEERLYETRCNHRRGSSAQHGAHDSRIQVASALIENAIFHTRHLQTGFGCEQGSYLRKKKRDEKPSTY